MFKIPPKGHVNNHTPLKPIEDSSLTYDEMEDVSFRVSKLEYMIKGNVKMDDLVKLENNMSIKEDIKGMASKEDLKGMVSKEDLKGMDRNEDIQDLKESMKDIIHNFIPHVSTQEEDKEEKEDLFQSHQEKIEKQLGSRMLES